MNKREAPGGCTRLPSPADIPRMARTELDLLAWLLIATRSRKCLASLRCVDVATVATELRAGPGVAQHCT